MSDSLKDQLLKLGFKKAERTPERPPQKPHGKPHGRSARPVAARQAAGPVATQSAATSPRPAKGEFDLAKAYALRAQTERAERERAEREAQEKARIKKERKAKLAALLEGKSLNDTNADVARHFPHGEKIRRVYVTPAQLEALNRGELGVVQQQGRYVLVARDVALEAKAIWDEALVLLPDPDAPAEDDIPPDLVW